MIAHNDRSLTLRRVRSWDYEQWRRDQAVRSPHRLFIGVSGYESRSRDWLARTLRVLPPDGRNAYLVLGFDDYRDVLNRPGNDEFYEKQGLEVLIPEDKGVDILTAVKHQIEAKIQAAGEDPLEVHVDYSSMPRSWYCNLPFVLSAKLRYQDEVFFWYTPGEYAVIEYPTAGVEDFNVFSGQPSLRQEPRTHFFGLGFDRIRSHAIWSVLDPENLVCFYASPGSREDYVQRVQEDNKDVLAAADFSFTIDLRDFASAYSRIAGVVREFHLNGDVVLVPDGPKPLILASSLVPVVLGYQGITCFHVSRRKIDQSAPVDVKAIAPAAGFSFSVPAPVEQVV